VDAVTPIRRTGSRVSEAEPESSSREHYFASVIERSVASWEREFLRMVAVSVSRLPITTEIRDPRWATHRFSYVTDELRIPGLVVALLDEERLSGACVQIATRHGCQLSWEEDGSVTFRKGGVREQDVFPDEKSFASGKNWFFEPLRETMLRWAPRLRTKISMLSLKNNRIARGPLRPGSKTARLQSH
jgi:hypothetical protein